MLKGRGFLMFDDSSYLNRELLKALNRRPEVENQWITGGRVYAKLQNCTKKVLFLITDDLDLKIAQNRPTGQAPTAVSDPNTINPPNASIGTGALTAETMMVAAAAAAAASTAAATAATAATTTAAARAAATAAAATAAATTGVPTVAETVAEIPLPNNVTTP
jgi:hypothetical protein